MKAAQAAWLGWAEFEPSGDTTVGDRAMVALPGDLLVPQGLPASIHLPSFHCPCVCPIGSPRGHRWGAGSLGVQEAAGRTSGLWQSRCWGSSTPLCSFCTVQDHVFVTQIASVTRGTRCACALLPGMLLQSSFS